MSESFSANNPSYTHAIGYGTSQEFALLFDWMNTYLKSTLDANTRPSLSANLVYLDRVIWKGNFGNMSKLNPEPPTEDTIYR